MVERLRLERRLGTWIGGSIGLALAAGLWGPDALGLWPAHVPLVYPSLLIGLAGLLLIGLVAGQLAARTGQALASAAIWLVAAVATAVLAGHLSYEVSSVLVWLVDRRFWGLPIYPFDGTAQARLVTASLPMSLALIGLGLVENYRMDGLIGALNRQRMSPRAWLLLLLPLPLALAAGLAADAILNQPLRTPLTTVAEIIRVGHDYRGDLDALSRQTGLNYGALIDLRGSLSPNFQLGLGDVSLGDEQLVVVVAHFDNGAWINCRVLVGRVSFCDPAQAPYTQGLSMLLAGQDISQCQNCQLEVSADWQAWLRDQGRFTGTPQITRLAQWGSYVLMRAANPGSGYAVACLFQGTRTVTLVRCREASLT
jgi:hypothetical protein